jgi:hypothetical protein
MEDWLVCLQQPERPVPHSAGHEYQGRSVNHIIFAVNRKLYQAVKIVRVVWVAAKKTDDFAVVMHVFVKQGVARLGFFVPGGIHLESARHLVPVYPKQALREKAVEFPEFRADAVRFVQFLNYVFARHIPSLSNAYAPPMPLGRINICNAGMYPSIIKRRIFLWQ